MQHLNDFKDAIKEPYEAIFGKYIFLLFVGKVLYNNEHTYNVVSRNSMTM
jgi:hypothetical protein